MSEVDSNCALSQIPSVPGVEFREAVGWPRYAVGSDGSVWSCRRYFKAVWHRLRPAVSNRGYQLVSLSRADRSKRSVSVHRLVLEAFVGACPPGCETRHLDGNSINNRLENLAYGTHAENYRDAVAHGTHKNIRGLGILTKLTADEVEEIKRLHDSGMSAAAIRRLGRFNASKKTILKVVGRRIVGTGMTRMQALRILIEHAAQNVSGVGCGIRPDVDEKTKARVGEAVSKVWLTAYQRRICEADYFNLRLPPVND